MCYCAMQYACFHDSFLKNSKKNSLNTAITECGLKTYIDVPFQNDKIVTAPTTIYVPQKSHQTLN